jgi:hypothetical protein
MKDWRIGRVRLFNLRNLFTPRTLDHPGPFNIFFSAHFRWPKMTWCSAYDYRVTRAPINCAAPRTQVRRSSPLLLESNPSQIFLTSARVQPRFRCIQIFWIWKTSGLQQDVMRAKLETARRNHSAVLVAVLCAAIILIFFNGAVSAQQQPAISPETADAGSAQSTTGADQTQTPPQSTSQDESQKHKSPMDETVGILSRKSIFFPDLATDRCPLTSKQKFKLSVDKTISPSTWVSATFSAAYKQALNSYPGYGQGWGAYGERYGAAIASSATTNFSALSYFRRSFTRIHATSFTTAPDLQKKLNTPSLARSSHAPTTAGTLSTGPEY